MLVTADGVNVNLSNDIRSFNGASLGTNCIQSGGNKACIVSTAKGGSTAAWDSVVAELQAFDSSYTLPKTQQNNYDDYWQVAKDYCEKIGGGHLPSETELQTIARVLYDNSSIASSSEYGLTMKNKTAVYAALGIEDLAPGLLYLWSDTPFGAEVAYARSFGSDYTSYTMYNYRYNTDIRMVCLGE